MICWICEVGGKKDVRCEDAYTVVNMGWDVDHGRYLGLSDTRHAVFDAQLRFEGGTKGADITNKKNDC